MHPDVDYSKLDPKQRQDVAAWISEIKATQKEYHQLKRQAYKNRDYEAQRKNQESAEFFDDCMRACSKEIIKIHETN
jgi:hypothetical protein